MAVLKETAIDRYVGLSTDSKPTSVRAGSIFHEYNTRVDYITYDGTNWVVLSNDIKELSVSKTLVQGSEPIHVNLFSFTGPFRLLRLYGVCTEATDSSDCDDAYFNIWDGTVNVILSDDETGSGITLTNITVKSVFGINAASSVDAFYSKSDQCRYLAASSIGPELWQSGLITAKNAVTNYVRFTYDSATNSGIDIDIVFHIIYADIDGTAPSVLTAV